MAQVMSQQGFGLSVPGSRQDVISALLNDYGNSFGRGDSSPSAYSPVPADKELPPPPPRSDSLDKPLPAVQRAEQRMSMKFQLRGRRILFMFCTRKCEKDWRMWNSVYTEALVLERRSSPTRIPSTVAAHLCHDTNPYIFSFCFLSPDPTAILHYYTSTENMYLGPLTLCSYRRRAAVSEHH